MAPLAWIAGMGAARAFWQFGERLRGRRLVALLEELHYRYAFNSRNHKPNAPSALSVHSQREAIKPIYFDILAARAGVHKQ